jgi:hypothetical protein
MTIEERLRLAFEGDDLLWLIRARDGIIRALMHAVTEAVEEEREEEREACARLVDEQAREYRRLAEMYSAEDGSRAVAANYILCNTTSEHLAEQIRARANPPR